MSLSKLKTAIIEDSGSFKGSFAAGCTEALYEARIIPTDILCCSVGCLNGSKVAETNSLASVEELKKIWIQIEKEGPRSVFCGSAVWNLLSRWDLKHPSLYSKDGLRRLVKMLNLLEAVNSSAEIHVNVYNETTKQFEIVSSRETRFQKNAELFGSYLLGAISLPGSFDPEKIHRHFYSDSFAIGPLMEKIFQSGLDLVVVFLNEFPDSKPNPAILPWYVRDFLARYRLTDYINENSLKQYLISNPDVEFFDYGINEEDPLIIRNVLDFSQTLKRDFSQQKRFLVVIAPRISIPTLIVNDFHPGDISKAWKHGCQHTKAVLNKLAKEIKK